MEDAPGSQKGTKTSQKMTKKKKQKANGEIKKKNKTVTAHDAPKKLEDSKATETVTKPDGATVWKHKPRYSVEMSCAQITCRTGWLGKGKSHLITFAAVGGVEAARAQAETWVSADMSAFECM